MILKIVRTYLFRHHLLQSLLPIQQRWNLRCLLETSYKYTKETWSLNWEWASAKWSTSLGWPSPTVKRCDFAWDENRNPREIWIMDRLFAQVHCSHLHSFHQLDVCRGPALAVEQRRHVVVLHLELLHLPDRKGWHGDEMKTKDNKLFEGGWGTWRWFAYDRFLEAHWQGCPTLSFRPCTLADQWKRTRLHFNFYDKYFHWDKVLYFVLAINTWHSQSETHDKEILELGDHDLVQADHVLHVPLLVPSPDIMVLDHHGWDQTIFWDLTISRNLGYHSRNLSLDKNCIIKQT